MGVWWSPLINDILLMETLYNLGCVYTEGLLVCHVYLWNFPRIVYWQLWDLLNMVQALVLGSALQTRVYKYASNILSIVTVWDIN